MAHSLSSRFCKFVAVKTPWTITMQRSRVNVFPVSEATLCMEHDAVGWVRRAVAVERVVRICRQAKLFIPFVSNSCWRSHCEFYWRVFVLLRGRVGIYSCGVCFSLSSRFCKFVAVKTPWTIYYVAVCGAGRNVQFPVGEATWSIEHDGVAWLRGAVVTERVVWICKQAVIHLQLSNSCWSSHCGFYWRFLHFRVGVFAFIRVVFVLLHVLKSRPLSAANIKDFVAAMENVTLDAFDYAEQQVCILNCCSVSVAAQGESFQVFPSRWPYPGYVVVLGTGRWTQCGGDIPAGSTFPMRP